MDDHGVVYEELNGLDREVQSLLLGKGLGDVDGSEPGVEGEVEAVFVACLTVGQHRELLDVSEQIIDNLFKQLKQNFPLRYFYGESANAIKIQIWVTLIANLLFLVIQSRVKRSWSFSGLATMFRIMLMYYVNCYTFLESPEKDWTLLLEKAEESPPEPTLFD